MCLKVSWSPQRPRLTTHSLFCVAKPAIPCKKFGLDSHGTAEVVLDGCVHFMGMWHDCICDTMTSDFVKPPCKLGGTEHPSPIA